MSQFLESRQGRLIAESTKVATRCVGAICAKSDHLWQDFFSIDQPSLAGLEVLRVSVPSDESLGYCQSFLRNSDTSSRSYLHVQCVQRSGTVYDFFRELAKMGGFLERKHEGEPGWQTVWQDSKKCNPYLPASVWPGYIDLE